MPGPQEQRLVRALQGAAPGTIGSHGLSWEQCALLLTTVGRQLAAAKLPIRGGEAGALTAEAMNSAFAKTAEGMAKRSHQLRFGNEALGAAANALSTARTA